MPSLQHNQLPAPQSRLSLAPQGPDGSGETTVFNLITGVYSPTSGEILVGALSVEDNVRADFASRAGSVLMRGVTGKIDAMQKMLGGFKIQGLVRTGQIVPMRGEKRASST